MTITTATFIRNPNLAFRPFNRLLLLSISLTSVSTVDIITRSISAEAVILESLASPPSCFCFHLMRLSMESPHSIAILSPVSTLLWNKLDRLSDSPHFSESRWAAASSRFILGDCRRFWTTRCHSKNVDSIQSEISLDYLSECRLLCHITGFWYILIHSLK